MVAQAEHVDEVRDLLAGLVDPTRAEDGCVVYELLQNAADPTVFTFVEEWTSDAALDAHLASDHIAAALGRLPDVLDGAPVIERFTLVK